MITEPKILCPFPSESWQQDLASAIREPAQLLRLLELDLDDFPWLIDSKIDFPIKVTRSFVDRMEKANPKDPLLLQVLPDRPEFYHNSEGLTDPVGDLDSLKAPGLLHKYQGRVLVIAAPSCASHCRYCFRRHFPYQEQQKWPTNWEEQLAYILGNPAIEEVILSGGDPLVLSDAKLQTLLESLDRLTQIQTIRIHTRTPIFLPNRVTDTFCEMMASLTKTLVMVLHINHPNELNGPVLAAIEKLTRQGVRLFNQSVLLRGVNDSAETLEKLSKSLFSAGIQPYYLHLLDRTKGAMHYDVPRQEAIQIIADVRVTLPGYLVPQLVEEIPGHPYKQPLIDPPLPK